MNDYAAAPAQPILQGLVVSNIAPPPRVQTEGLKFLPPGYVPSFYGRGCSDVTADATGIILTLDAGLPGDVALTESFARTMVTVRAVPPLLATINITISYPDEEHVKVSLTDSLGFPIFPRAFEIIVWRGDAGVEPANVNIVGGVPPVIQL
jgi:hypothetical protein